MNEWQPKKEWLGFFIIDNAAQNMWKPLEKHWWRLSCSRNITKTNQHNSLALFSTFVVQVATTQKKIW
jgi:hypothetical protein